MSDLESRLRAAVAFDADVHAERFDPQVAHWPATGIFERGRKDENARLQPILDKLIAALRKADEALSRISEERDMKPAKYAKQFAAEARAELVALLKGGE